MENEEELLKELNIAMSRANGMYQKWFQESGINSFLAQTLYALYMEPTLSQKEISERYQMPRQTVNNVVKSLEKDGYIVLTPDPKDKRGRRIAFTESGKAYTEQTILPLLTLDKKVVACLGERKLKQLIACLQAYGDALEKAAKRDGE